MADKFTLKGDHTIILRARPNGTPLTTRDAKAGDEVVLTKEQVVRAVAAGVIDDPNAPGAAATSTEGKTKPAGGDAPAPDATAKTSAPSSVKG